jgi:hypothetical protein
MDGVFCASKKGVFIAVLREESEFMFLIHLCVRKQITILSTECFLWGLCHVGGSELASVWGKLGTQEWR